MYIVLLVVLLYFIEGRKKPYLYEVGYAFFFGLVLDGFYLILNNYSSLSMITRILLGFFSIVLADVSKYFLVNGTGPKHPLVLVIRGVSLNTRFSIDKDNKSVSVVLILLSGIVSIFNSVPFLNQISILTIAFMFITGFGFGCLDEKDCFNLKPQTNQGV